MIIIKDIILYFKHITDTDDFPLNGYPASGLNNYTPSELLGLISDLPVMICQQPIMVLLVMCRRPARPISELPARNGN